SIGNPVIIDVEPEFSVKNVGLFKYYDRELSNPTYLLNYLKLAETWFKEESSGAVQSFVSLGKLRIYPFPLAPLAEQKRIVAKIDELMALCDQLEVQQQQQANTLLKANTAAIHALLYADDGYSKKHKAGSQNKQYKKQENFKVAWERIANNFHTLYGNTLPMPPGEGRQKKYFVGLENVKQLRQMILNLAVIGHLTSKDKSDTPFSLYLDKLDTYCEKNNITRVKVRTGHLEEVDDIKLSLPEGWEYASLTQVAYFLGGGTPSKNISSFWGGNIPWVSPKDMKTDNIVDSELKITEIGLNSSTVKLIPVNSLLVVARSGILKRTLPVATNTIECTLNQDMKAIVPIKPELQPYIKLLLQGFTPFILKNLVKGGMTVQSLRYKEFEAFKFPFPPQEEQNRIVAKVDQLMVLCDQLEQQLTTAYGNVKKLTTTTLKALVV
ncbi:MAG: restriction endonuclease subunit S, partial [Arenicellales bacterium]